MPQRRKPIRRHPRSTRHRTLAQRQAGKGLEQLILPLAKFIGPLILGEAAKFGIKAGIKKIRGRGLTPAGAGLKLAGQGKHRRIRRRKKMTQAQMNRKMAKVRSAIRR